MTQPRSTQVSLEDTAYYHCIARCVRRSFLCGEDKYSGKSFGHRRLWLVERVRLLSQVFAIDICAYAIMSNHYHLVLFVDSSTAKAWSNAEVVERWTSLYKAPLIIQRWQRQELKSQAEVVVAEELITLWRERLQDLSWFMSNLNEHIARKANQEEGCKGRFWEGRFKSQALLDEQALLSCMAYVDLNPIRAGMAQTLEESEFTSIYERIHSVCSADDNSNGQLHALPRKGLFGFLGGQREQQPCNGVAFSLLDYLSLLQELGQQVKPDKRGYIPPQNQTILQKFNLSSDKWQRLSDFFGSAFCCAVGTLDELESYASHTNRSWVSNKAKVAIYLS